VGLLIPLIVVATSIWVAIDASKLRVKRGILGGGFLDLGAGSWCVACLALWLVAFPCYLYTRPKYVAVRPN